MYHLQLLNNDTNYSAAVELTMIDGMRRKKNVLLLFNMEDEWRAAEDFTSAEVQGMFAGAIMELLRKDASAFAYRATAYSIQDNIVKKSVSFTPMVKIDDEFKECHIDENGRFELVD